VLIDQQTIGDLEIFRTRDGKPGVFQTLDRTKTPGGLEALRSRFAGPFSNGASIRRVQDGIRFLLTEKIQFPLDPNMVLEVRQYLDSSWDVGSRAGGLRFFVESIVSSIRYRDLFNHALRGVGVNSSWKFVMEFFGWRNFKNRRELGALSGLTPTPYDSGGSQREQGISKAGNKRIRTLAVEMAWVWLRFQPQSKLSQWFVERFAPGGSRMRRIGIVAVARRLLVDLWRYLEYGVIPEGAQLKSTVSL